MLHPHQARYGIAVANGNVGCASPEVAVYACVDYRADTVRVGFTVGNVWRIFSAEHRHWGRGDSCVRPMKLAFNIS
ncbi:hypothetical protein PoB_005410800 [Plakobranchus ocellatus]|uniref:Uncharacterized protein n=1 Tax=Plakobranchus ocellatus TaxID=259542 RepID=A0AAV4C7W6_9GAST|nr:hypothetical protein PoB_005410800 [Plakobranchus ocellatus]